ncbi:hypothetical protein C8J57DRAFT_987393, partial [Mycena rebaudengoi]
RLIDSLTSSEEFWYHRDWLEAKGYTLRPRYRKGWVLSWTGTNKIPLSLEDAV